jgi:hypothetical protein
MDTASLYQNIISAIRGAFIEPAEKFGVSIVELKAFDPSIDELISHLKGLIGILKLFADDNHSEINTRHTRQKHKNQNPCGWHALSWWHARCCHF